MKKILMIGIAGLMLAGCASTRKEVSESTASASAIPSVSAESTVSAEIPDQLEIIEGVVEEDLPLTLRVTIQDMEVLFTKADAYTCEDVLEAGDSVRVYFDGDLENRPVVYEVEKE